MPDRINPFRSRPFVLGLLAALGAMTFLGVSAQAVDPRVLEAEKKRVAVVDKVRPSVVAIFSPGGQGGGSGVLISKDGYTLTNFHVVQGSGAVMKCGLSDGVLYDAVLVGLDKVGDVALVKLLPSKPGQDFPFAVMGDSDKVKAGDWSLAMGNPFLLATDFTPTVTFGLISGVHRYQHPEGRGLLEYTDCIQIDTSINPGNSGGPLFNMEGELIGINGRGSFDKRGRVNSGVGYAISINQIKNFLGHLKGGLDTDHASLGATVRTVQEEGVGEKMMVNAMLEECDVARRGLIPGDELVSFDGRPMGSVNQFKNVLGVYPKGSRVPLVYRHENKKKEVLVRLMGVLAQEIDDNGKPKDGDEKPALPAPKKKAAVKPQGPAAKLYEAKPGFANYYFNRQERDRVLSGFRKHGDFSGLTGPWTISGEEVDANKKKGEAVITLRQEKGKQPQVHLLFDALKYDLEPLKGGQKEEDLQQPSGSGGLMMAMYHYQQLLTRGEKGFTKFSYGGREPFYPPPADGVPPKSLNDLRVEADVIRTEDADINGKWYFSPKDQTLLGFELTVKRGGDPCEVYLSDYRKVDGRLLPHRMDVHYGNDRFATLYVKSYQLAK